MDQTLFGEVSAGMLRFLGIWYNEWGAFLAFLLGLVSTFVIFLDAFRQQISAMWWKVAGVVGTILVIPSLVLRVSPELGASIGPALVPLAFVGLIGALVAFLSLVTYLAWGRGAELSVVLLPETEPYSSPLTPPSTPVYPEAGFPPFMESGPPVATPTLPAMDAAATSAMPVSGVTRILKRPPKELGMLVVRSGPRTGQSFPLQEITSIGRDSERNEISLDDSAMSRENTRIKLESGKFVIYDLASTNGTLVNGEKILKQVLANGDDVQIGDTHFAFVEVKTQGA